MLLCCCLPAARLDSFPTVAQPSDVKIVTRGGSAGRSRGFGFVRVPNEKAEQALTLNNTQLEGT